MRQALTLLNAVFHEPPTPLFGGVGFSSLERQIRSSSAVCIQLDQPNLGTAFFIAGYARARRLPLLFLVELSVADALGDQIAGIDHVTLSLDEPGSVSNVLNAFLTQPPAVSFEKSTASRPKQADVTWARAELDTIQRNLLPAHSLTSIVSRLLEQAGAIVSEPPPYLEGKSRGADLVAWVDELQPSLGNPLRSRPGTCTTTL